MSAALDVWNGTSREASDEIEAVHGRVMGAGGEGRILTRQINFAYTILIVAHFQQYCRAVHTEAAKALVSSAPDWALAEVLEGFLERGRQLERGNPTPGNLGHDFGRFGFRFREAVEAGDRRSRKRKEMLADLCEWRNGITHGDIARKREEEKLVPASLTLGLGGLAATFDRVIAAQCKVLGCQKAW